MCVPLWNGNLWVLWTVSCVAWCLSKANKWKNILLKLTQVKGCSAKQAHERMMCVVMRDSSLMKYVCWSALHFVVRLCLLGLYGEKLTGELLVVSFGFLPLLRTPTDGHSYVSWGRLMLRQETCCDKAHRRVMFGGIIRRARWTGKVAELGLLT